MKRLNVENLNLKIKELNGCWTASNDYTSLSYDTENIEKISGFNQLTISESLYQPKNNIISDYPIEFDWRELGHVTSIKFQGYCGSCVSFATVSVLESMISIEKGLSVNLSEADHFFCSSHGTNHNEWWPSVAFEQIKTRGVSDEECFPYHKSIIYGCPICEPCSDRENRTFKVNNVVKLFDNTETKKYISTIGPVTAIMKLYLDFFYYGNGIYNHIEGDFDGEHCVTIVGYSDINQCWICKNSFGKYWGDNGYFKIAYGDCDIDTYEKNGISGVILPNPVNTINDFYISPLSIYVPQIQGDFNITVTSNDEWETSTDLKWVILSVSDNNVNVKYLSNNDVERFGIIIIKSKNKTIEFIITQQKNFFKKLF